MPRNDKCMYVDGSGMTKKGRGGGTIKLRRHRLCALASMLAPPYARLQT